MHNRFKKILYRIGLDSFVDDDRATNRLRMLFSFYFSSFIVQLLSGSFLVGFLVMLGADDRFIGTYSLCCSLAGISQLLSPLIFGKLSRKKPLAITFRAIYYFLFIIVTGLISLPGFQSKQTLWILLAVVMIATVLNNLAAPPTTTWHLQNITSDHISHQYFSFLSISNAVVVPFFSMFMSKVVDVIKLAQSEHTAFWVFRGICVLLAVLDIINISKIKEYPYEQAQSTPRPRKLLTTTFGYPKYLRIIAIAALWNFSIAIPGPYFAAYLQTDLRQSYTWIYTIGLLAIPTLVLGSRFWNRYHGRLSDLKLLSIAIFTYAISLIPQVFVSQSTLILYPLSIVSTSFALSYINIGMSKIPYIELPQQDRISHLASFSTTGIISVFLGNSFGKLIIQLMGDFHMTIFGFMIPAKPLLVGIAACFVFMLSGLVLLYSKTVLKGY